MVVVAVDADSQEVLAPDEGIAPLPIPQLEGGPGYFHIHAWPENPTQGPCPDEAWTCILYMQRAFLLGGLMWLPSAKAAAREPPALWTPLYFQAQAAGRAGAYSAIADALWPESGRSAAKHDIGGVGEKKLSVAVLLCVEFHRSRALACRVSDRCFVWWEMDDEMACSWVVIACLLR